MIFSKVWMIVPSLRSPVHTCKHHCVQEELGQEHRCHDCTGYVYVVKVSVNRQTGTIC